MISAQYMLLSGGQAHFIFQFLCVEGARPADVHSGVKHVYGDDCSIHQCLTGARGSNKVGAALRTWHTPVIHPTLWSQTHMPTWIKWCSVIVV